VTHVLLAVTALVRRADVAEVIGAALAARARGAGFRQIAAAAGRPPETVRGWLRRWAGGPGGAAAAGLTAAAGCAPGRARWQPDRFFPDLWLGV
jgi:Homeodomain-like domain